METGDQNDKKSLVEMKEECQNGMDSCTEGEKEGFVSSVDEILVLVGEFGRYQKLMIVFVSLLYIPVAVHPFLMYFATFVPAWKCRSNSTICSFNGTRSGDNNLRCQIPRNEWTYTEEKSFSAVTSFDLSCDELWILSLITFMYFAGWGIGAIVIGEVADRYGRKAPMVPSLTITLATGVVSPFVPNIYLLVLCSFVLGFCYPGIETQASILLSELVGTEWRPHACRISTAMFPITWMLLAFKAYLLKNWVILSLVCSLPYTFTIAICFLIPESVRWLQINGKYEQVQEIFSKIGKFNKKELSNEIFVSKPSLDSVSSRSPLKDIFGSRGSALQTFALIIIWIFTLLCYYGLIIASPDLEGNAYTNFALVSVMEFPGILLAVIACQRIGRKGATLIFLALGSITCLIIPWIPKEVEGNVARLVLGMIGRLAIGINYHGLVVWTTELYPTKFRSTALGVMHATARVGASSSPWVVKGLKAFGKWIPFTIMGVCALIGCMAGLGLRETKGDNLMETDWYDEKNELVVPACVSEDDTEL